MSEDFNKHPEISNGKHSGTRRNKSSSQDTKPPSSNSYIWAFSISIASLWLAWMLYLVLPFRISLPEIVIGIIIGTIFFVVAVAKTTIKLFLKVWIGTLYVTAFLGVIWYYNPTFDQATMVVSLCILLTFGGIIGMTFSRSGR